MCRLMLIEVSSLDWLDFSQNLSLIKISSGLDSSNWSLWKRIISMLIGVVGRT